MITNKQLEDALTYLAETDDEAAKARARALYCEQKLKTVGAVAFCEATGAMAMRKAKALAGSEYAQALEDYRDAVYSSELLRNKRKSAELTVEVWRSENANRRAGNVT